jgi:Tripartite tricarboxylate transporter family receptor
LLVTSTTLAINKALYRKLPYDPVRDFTPIALVAGVPFALIVSPSLPAKTLPEFIAYAKSNPGLAYGSAGNGSPQHLGAEMLKAAAGIDVRHVSYRGSVPAMLDVIAGRIPFMVVDLLPALPQIHEGKVRALGVTTPGRVAAAPEIPSLAEAGLAGFELVAGRGGANRCVAGDRRSIGGANRKTGGRSGDGRQTGDDGAGAIDRLHAGQFCDLCQDRDRSLGRYRQEFGRRSGMINMPSLISAACGASDA